MDTTLGRNWIDISAKELEGFLNQRKLDEMSFTLLDVRNPNEQDICTIPGTDLLIPVKELSSKLSLLPDKDSTLVVYCKSGIRSTTACKLLSEQDYKKIYHLAEGILSYAREVDPEMAEY